MGEENRRSSPTHMADDIDEMVSADQVSQKTEIDLLKWEIDFLKREKVLIEREKNLRPESSEAGSVPLSEYIQNKAEMNCMKMGIHEVKTLINEFNPSNNMISADSWLESIEGLKQVYGWNEKNTLLYATLRLGGAAYFWYQSKQDAIKTFQEFKKELLRSFPFSHDQTSILRQIMERKRLPLEPIEDFAYQIAALAIKIKLNEASTIKYIISRLSGQDLINVLMASNCNTIPHLLVIIKTLN